MRVCVFIAHIYHTFHQDGFAEFDPEFKVGTSVAKKFGGAVYRGSIVDIDTDAETKCTLYIIEYEDGDSEDMCEKECRESIKYYQQLESGEIKEWEEGDE